MGVTNERRNPCVLGSNNDDIELIEDLLHAQEQVQEQAPRRTPKRNKKFQPLYVGEPLRYGKKGVRRMRRNDNMCFLLSLVETEEHNGEITDITELLEPSMSAFSELFVEQEKMKIWNEFINWSEEDQKRVLDGAATSLVEDKSEAESMEKDFEIVENKDQRNVHPAYTAEECYKRIDSNLKATLKKKQIPWGVLEHLETEVISFFQEWPMSVYISHQTNSYDRLLLHALCQYLGLQSQSFDDDRGARQTQVENKSSEFVTPKLPLSTFLECRSWCCLEQPGFSTIKTQ